MLSNVELGLEIQGISTDGTREQRAREYIELVGLVGFEKHFPHQISGGMQQRTGLARALSTRPRLLIMDEPFGAVDAQMRTLLQDELLRICEAIARDRPVRDPQRRRGGLPLRPDPGLQRPAGPAAVAEIAVDLPQAARRL